MVLRHATEMIANWEHSSCLPMLVLVLSARYAYEWHIATGSRHLVKPGLVTIIHYFDICRV